MLTRLTCLCVDIFSMQSTENTLFVQRECLASVGSFVLLLIHCLAHITHYWGLQPGFQPQISGVVL